MKNNPSFYKQKWFDHYERIAKAKGLVFTKRMFARVEHGFCMDEWLRANNKKRNINSMFQWCYTDSIEQLICTPNPLLKLITQPPEQHRVLSINGKQFIRKSHADLWRSK